MPTQIGVDVFDISRMQRAIDADNNIYWHSVFTDAELQQGWQSGDACRFFACRFALKEAAFKALNTQWNEQMEWHMIETTGQEYTAPGVVYHGPFGEIARQKGVVHSSASLSSDANLAFAAVVLTLQT
ncbi:holo-ACP synthase [Eubacteriales bacterium OttesenSCG-928-N14]|nr:holo-ACP synthase [Eubacteriales bacterium OttesenSCG-928-N14]